MKPSFNDATALFWAKSNNRTRGQFECDVDMVLFGFDVQGQGVGTNLDADGRGWGGGKGSLKIIPPTFPVSLIWKELPTKL